MLLSFDIDIISCKKTSQDNGVYAPLPNIIINNCISRY